MDQGMAAACASTPLAPGFVLWAPLPTTTTTTTTTTTDDESKNSPPYTSSSSPVLVVMFTWLFCSPRSAARYVDLYTRRGWHVLHVSSHLLHFLWPPSSHSFARDIARVLKEKCGDYGHVVVHAMSIGAYNYTTCRMLAREEERHPDLRDFFFTKLRAVVFDSLTMGSLDHMVRGVAEGLSQWWVVQSATWSLARLYFLLTHRTTVQAFNEGVEFFQTNPAPVPTLVFGCRNDPMCDVEALQQMLCGWSSSDRVTLTFRVWERSGHCANLVHHAEEYRQILGKFLHSLNLPLPAGDGGGHGGDCLLVSSL